MGAALPVSILWVMTSVWPKFLSKRSKYCNSVCRMRSRSGGLKDGLSEFSSSFLVSSTVIAKFAFTE